MAENIPETGPSSNRCSHQRGCALALPLPQNPARKVVLLLARKMAIHGLRDAQASMLAMQVFGSSFRKPLTLLRCFMHEVAACSNRNISVAPCCAPRMTRDEALLVDALATCDLASLAALTDNDDCGRALTVAIALRSEFEVLEKRLGVLT